jgi:hypothetical protein
MVGKVRSGKRQCTLKHAFKPQNKNLPKDGVSNRNTSSCLLETINIVPYLSSGIVLQPLINIVSQLSGMLIPSCNMRFPGWSPTRNAFFFELKVQSSKSTVTLHIHLDFATTHMGSS